MSIGMRHEDTCPAWNAEDEGGLFATDKG